MEQENSHYDSHKQNTHNIKKIQNFIRPLHKNTSETRNNFTQVFRTVNYEENIYQYYALGCNET